MSEPDFDGRLGALEARVAELAADTRAAREDAAAAGQERIVHLLTTL